MRPCVQAIASAGSNPAGVAQALASSYASSKQHPCLPVDCPSPSVLAPAISYVRLCHLRLSNILLSMPAAGNPGWNSPFAQSSASAFANANSQNPTATAAAFAAASARACAPAAGIDSFHAEQRTIAQVLAACIFPWIVICVMV